MTWEPRLPPLAQDALDILETIADDTGRFSHDEAMSALTGTDDFTQANAERTLEQLRQRGYIYYIDDCVRLTPTDD